MSLTRHFIDIGESHLPPDSQPVGLGGDFLSGAACSYPRPESAAQNTGGETKFIAANAGWFKLMNAFPWSPPSAAIVLTRQVVR